MKKVPQVYRRALLFDARKTCVISQLYAYVHCHRPSVFMTIRTQLKILLSFTLLQLYHQVVAMTQSFHAMSQFLSPQRDVITSLTMATSGLEGLWFTANQQFIAKAIDQSL